MRDSLGRFFSHAGEFFLSQSAQSSRSFLAHSFEPTECLRHTEFTERYCQKRVLGDSCYVLMISHRGISVITPLPSGEGTGEGPLPHRGISVITPLPFGEGTGEGPAGDGGGATIRRITNHVNRKCQDILQAIPLYNRDGAELEARRGPSAFKNMLFLVQEGRLLQARRACSYMLSVTF